jgi:orotidine-5'-phosphate decarboxylase
VGFNDRLDRLLEKSPSRLCIGLDPVRERLPSDVRPDRAGLVRYLSALVDATAPHAVAFKPNSAYFEALGVDGYGALIDLVAHIRSSTDAVVILDAKRGDIGHTAAMYARAAFNVVGADAITVSPYLGEDAIAPFAADAERGVFVLARTTNPGATAMQEVAVRPDRERGARHGEPVPFYRLVARLVRSWDKHGNLGLVAGATAPGPLAMVRQEVGVKMPILVPGVGAQGGELALAVAAAADANGRGFLINASRSVMYAAKGVGVAEAAVAAAGAARVMAREIEAAIPVPKA